MLNYIFSLKRIALKSVICNISFFSLMLFIECSSNTKIEKEIDLRFKRKLANAKIIIFLILLLFGTAAFNRAFGQATTDSTSISKNTIYLEALGNGGIYSFNYDRIIYINKFFQVTGRVGISFVPYLKRVRSTYNDIFTYPMEINLLYGKKNHAEIGIGFTPVFNLYNESIFKIYDIYSYLGIRFGYRFQKPNGGFFFRAGIIPVIYYPKYLNSKNSFASWWICVGFGYTFKQ